MVDLFAGETGRSDSLNFGRGGGPFPGGGPAPLGDPFRSTSAIVTEALSQGRGCVKLFNHGGLHVKADICGGWGKPREDADSRQRRGNMLRLCPR